jgi:hypothetical protein
MTLSYLNSLKIRLWRKRYFRVMNPGSVTIRGIYVVYILPQTATSPAQITADVAILSRIRRMVIGYSAWNYQIMDKESNGGIVIPLGITSSRMRNPPKEYFSTGNCKLMDEESTQGIFFHWELQAHG